MKKKSKLFLEGISLFIVLCIFTFFASKTNLSFTSILAISVLAFLAIVCPHLIFFIDGINRKYLCRFYDLEKNKEYKLIKKRGERVEVELSKERILIVKDFKKYAPFVNEGDYFVIKSFSPLNIEWIVRENASENIDFYI